MELSNDKAEHCVHVLLVEDDEHDQTAFNRACRKADFQCRITCCVSAEDALAQLKNNDSPIDIIVSDFNLPGISGFDFYQELETMDIDTPFVILTGSGSENLAVKALQAGVDDYFVKGAGKTSMALFPEVLKDVIKRHENQAARVLAEMRLAEAELRYRTLFCQSPDMILVIEPETGHLIEFNQHAQALLGYADDELLKMTFFDIDIGRSTDEIKRCLSSTSNTNRIQFETRYQTKDGDQRLVLVSVGMIPLTDQNVIQLVSRDITDQRQWEEENHKLQKLDSIGVLAGGLAHDFNNKLVGIIGNISLARNYFNRPDKLDVAFTRIEDAINRIKALTGRLITFAPGGLPIKEKIDLKSVLMEIIDEECPELKSICNCQVPDGICALEADKGQLREVITNIVTNADNAMPRGGTVQIHVDNFVADGQTIPCEKGRKFVRIRLSDEGHGIKEQQIAKLFDPFYSTKPGNMGLGLTIAHSIVRNHNGFLTVKSEVGKGTIIDVFLPAVEDLSSAPPAVQDISEDIKGLRVLFMDDELFVRDLIKEICDEAQINVDIVPDGQQAVEVFKNAKADYDLVILDLTNKIGMGGEETIKHLAAIEPSVKAIVCSGYANNPILSNFRAYGFLGVLHKPFIVEELLDAIYAVVGENR